MAAETRLPLQLIAFTRVLGGAVRVHLAGEVEHVTVGGVVGADQVIATVGEHHVAVEADRQTLRQVDLGLGAGHRVSNSASVVAAGPGSDHDRGPSLGVY